MKEDCREKVDLIEQNRCEGKSFGNEATEKKPKNTHLQLNRNHGPFPNLLWKNRILSHSKIEKLKKKKKSEFWHVFSDLEDALQTKLKAVERQWNTGKQFQFYPLKKPFKKLFIKALKTDGIK